MTKKKTTKKDGETQAPKTNIVNLPERHIYDMKLLEDFLELVFHSELEDDEEILTWIVKGIPAYPVSEDYLFEKLPRTPMAKALYFSTSTAAPDPTDGKIYNRKALFKRFHVLVLDDIGTKIDISLLKADFKPTYIIETSQGNFQYGYVLEDPITELEQAEALIQLVYEAGITDKGGRMANKLVRLPEGVNGKKGEKQNFRVKLILSNGPLWTPAQILDVLDLGVTWADIEKDALLVQKMRAHKGVGFTPWSPITPTLPSLNGIIDQALEWMYDKGMVKQETNEWVTIKCPWSEEHTSGGDWASYSPLGWGGAAYQNSRNFHCFHEHCASRKGSALLEYIAASNGPNVPAVEYAGHLTSTYAYDPTTNGVWKMTEKGSPFFIPIEGFRNEHPEKATVFNFKGEPKLISEVQLFIQSKARVSVYGQTYDPSTPAKVIQNRNDVNQINLYTVPPWGDGDYNEDHVNKFIQFINYLIPFREDREFYLDWLAAKAQSMAFRGPAILMIAPVQGTGRTTLGNMMKRLYGGENVERVPFERLAKGSEGFNEWIVKPLIITDETLALGNNDNFYKVYEKIKELIDTTPSEVRINPKFGKQRFQITYSSFMLFSNHEGAMKVADDDRRIYVMNNPVETETAEYFTDLNEWIKTDWPQAVWRWLRQRDVNVSKLLAPAKINLAKQDMIDAHKQPMDVAIRAILDAWPCAVIGAMQVKKLLVFYTSRLDLPDARIFEKRVNTVFQKMTLASKDTRKFRVDGTSIRLRVIPKANRGDIEVDYELLNMPDNAALLEIQKLIDDALSEHDF